MSDATQLFVEGSLLSQTVLDLVEFVKSLGLKGYRPADCIIVPGPAFGSTTKIARDVPPHEIWSHIL